MGIIQDVDARSLVYAHAGVTMSVHDRVGQILTFTDRGGDREPHDPACLQTLKIALRAELRTEIVDRPEARSVFHGAQSAVVFLDLLHVDLVKDGCGGAITAAGGVGTVQTGCVVNTGRVALGDGIAEHQKYFGIASAHEVIKLGLRELSVILRYLGTAHKDSYKDKPDRCR